MSIASLGKKKHYYRLNRSAPELLWKYNYWGLCYLMPNNEKLVVHLSSVRWRFVFIWPCFNDDWRSLLPGVRRVCCSNGSESNVSKNQLRFHRTRKLMVFDILETLSTTFNRGALRLEWLDKRLFLTYGSTTAAGCGVTGQKKVKVDVMLNRM